MFETLYATVVGYGYTGWIVAFLVIGAVRWSQLERGFFSDHPWPYLE